MSELAPGSVSLEDDTPLSAMVETPPPVDTPPPAADEAEVETIVNPNGEKLVPLGALAGAREKARAEKEAREALEAELAPLREKAALADRIKTEWDAAKPYIESVRNGTYQPPKPVETPAGPLTEQDAIEYAKDLDLYKADGTPDTARAQRLAARQEALADRKAQQYIAPLQQQSAQQQSAAHFEHVASWKDTTGAVVDRAILQDIWSKMPAELTAQPNVAAVMYRVALAETMLQGKHKAAPVPPPAPQHTESIGAAPTRSEMSAFERNFTQAVDMKPKEYEAISSRYKPGERNSLE